MHRKGLAQFPLLRAARDGNVETVERLVERREALVSRPTPADACRHSPLPILIVTFSIFFPYSLLYPPLISLVFVDLSRTNSQTLTSLSLSLFSSFVKVTTTDNEGWNALHFAAVEGHARTVERLCYEGAHVNVLTSSSRSALMFAAVVSS